MQLYIMVNTYLTLGNKDCGKIRFQECLPNKPGLGLLPLQQRFVFQLERQGEHSLAADNRHLQFICTAEIRS